MERNQLSAEAADAVNGPVRVAQLTESHRFDGELATLLTRFQYGKDGITLTAADPAPMPASAYDAPTNGLEAVFANGASLVFVCYDDRGHRMVNSIETMLIETLTTAVHTTTPGQPDGPAGGTLAPLGEGPIIHRLPPSDDRTNIHPLSPRGSATEDGPALSFGVVTPHNAQRGALETALPEAVTANTVEKYQGGERDIIAVSGTVSDPEFARREEEFILNPRRLLVAISRSRLLTIVVCSTALFEVVPGESERLEDGPVWARLFTQAVGRDPEPAWAGSLAAFTPGSAVKHADVPVRVYPSTVAAAGSNDGEQP